MKKNYTVLLGFLVIIYGAQAQTLEVNFDAEFLQKQAGEQLTSIISVSPPTGFKASIFLKISSPTLPITNKNLSTEIVNAPFPKTVNLSYFISLDFFQKS